MAVHTFDPVAPMNNALAAGQRILIIDDDRDFAESLGEVFESLGHQIALAASREEARQTLLWYRPDMAIVDVRLGQEDGIDVIPMVRRSQPDTLCIVVTAYADMDTAVRALRAGAYDFLHKPVRMPELTVLLQHSLARIQLQRERRDALDRLADSEERLRNLVEGSLQGIMVIENEKPVFANPTLADIFGHESLDSLLAIPSVSGLFGARDRDRVMNLIGHVSRDPSHVVSMQAFQGRRLSGESVWLETTLRHVRWGKSGAVQAVMVDVTERRRFEEERNRLAAAVEQSPNAVFITDVKGAIVYVNPAFERITGHTSTKAIGAAPEHLGVRKSNPYADFTERNAHAPANQWSDHGRYVREDGSSYQCESSTLALRDEEGQLAGFVEVRQDTTEEERLQEQLRQAQKMEAIGILAGGIAHDFNNLLTPILGFAELTRKGFPESDQIYRDLTIVHDSAQRAKDLVEQILVFSRKREPRRGIVDLRTVASNAIALLRATLPKSVCIEERITPSSVWIIGDGSLCQQVLMNLCINAHQAMPEHGTLSVVLEPVTLDRLPTRFGDSVTGHFARMSVLDTGHGMDADTLQRVFEPFFTTKKDKSGTGLGLSIVFGIVNSHHGHIDVQSTVGRGSQFDVYLPLADPPLAAGDSGPVPMTSAAAGSILLVDDEAANCELGKRTLEGSGYAVKTFTDPRSGLQSVLEEPTRYDLLITDEAMPEVQGHELVRMIRQAGCGVPVMLMSGYNATVTQDMERTLGIAKVLAKPYTQDELVTAVGDIMGSVRRPAGT